MLSRVCSLALGCSLGVVAVGCATATSSADAGGSGAEADAAPVPLIDSGGPEIDGAVLTIDAATPAIDAATPTIDAATPTIDASPDSPDASAILPDAAVVVPDAAIDPADAAGATTVTLTHSTSQTITTGNSISCNGGSPNFYHAGNSYYRTFDLAAAGVTGDFTLASVGVGIEEATAGTGGTQAANLRFYTLSGNFDALANLTSLGTVAINVADQGMAVTDFGVAGIVAPAGSVLVVEFETPDGQTAQNRIFIGSNGSGESAATYMTATSCTVAEPATTGSLGFPNMHWVLNVTGTH